MYLIKSLLLTSLVTFLTPLSSIAQSYSVGWELWYPYQYHSNKQQLTGLDIDIFNAVTKQAGLKINYTELPWKRHLHYLKTGDMDIAMGASYNEERAKYAHFTEPYRLEIVKLYVRKGQAKNISLNSLNELGKSSYMIGVEGGYYYGKSYQELMQNIEFQAHINEVIDLEENVSLLLKGHLDGFLVDPVAMKAFVEKYKLHNEFEQHPIVIYQDDIHIMLSKKSMNKESLIKLNQAIITLKQNGSLAEINAKWTKLQHF